MSSINKNNVGRIAERIVSNELEFLGFRVSDLNTGGTAANADLLAVKNEKTWQIQVKGATNDSSFKHWWVQYGHCSDEAIAKTEPMFNRRTSFYTAQIVILVAVRSPKDYRCIVMPVKDAERAVQLNLERYYRQPKKDGSARKKGKVWIALDHNPNARRESALLDQERKILSKHENAWETLL